MYALGVLDPTAEPGLDAIADLAARITGSPVSIVFKDGSNWIDVAGTRSGVEPVVDPPHQAAGSDSAARRLPVVIAGLEVGQVRGVDPSGQVLSDAASAVSDFLLARLRQLRRDSRDRPVAVLVVDGAGTVGWVSTEFDQLFGLRSSEWLGRSALDLLVPNVREAATTIFSHTVASPGRTAFFPYELITGGGTASFEVQPDNRLFDPEVEALGLVIRPSHDPPDEHTAFGDQIWVLNRLGNGAPLEEVLLRVVELCERRDPDSHACLMRLDSQSESLTPLVSPRLPEVVVSALAAVPVGPNAPSGGATVHFSMPRFTSDFSQEERWEPLRGVLSSHGYRGCWSVPVTSMTGSGELGSIDVYRRVSGRPTESDARVLLVAARLAAVAIDHDAHMRRLRFGATHDPLTHLPNRALFAERLAACTEGKVGVLFVDLDRFKLVNDTLGHDFGDDLLCLVSDRLAEQVREPAVVARFGGDEFTILLPKVESLGEVVEVGVQLLEVISRPYLVRGQSITIGASAGATFAVDPPEDAGSLVRDADAALYHAKDRGRGRVEAFDTRLLTALADRVRVERALRESLDADLLGVAYQPVVRVADGVAIGAEALARCSTLHGLDVPPGVFIPVAEEVGLIPRVFASVLADACRSSARWNADPSRNLVVWVNLSPLQLGTRDLVDQVEAAAALAGAHPANLGFEVTERSILPDPVEAAHRLGELAELGAHLAVDDFGTGHASLGYLQELPVDTVKLDQSFVVRAGYDARSRAIVHAIVELALAMDLSCVAEGVETAAQLDVVVGLGCEVVQGFVFSRPLGADDLTRWLERHSPAPAGA